MDNWLLISVLILLCLVWLLLLRNFKAALLHKDKNSSSTNPRARTYHSVSINPCSQACKCISCFKGRRLLANEATELPIYGCTNPECTCTYIHHEDRRDGDDRRFKSLIMESLFSKKDHRFKKGGERRRQNLA